MSKPLWSFQWHLHISGQAKLLSAPYHSSSSGMTRIPHLPKTLKYQNNAWGFSSLNLFKVLTKKYSACFFITIFLLFDTHVHEASKILKLKKHLHFKSKETSQGHTSVLSQFADKRVQMPSTTFVTHRQT